MLTQSSTPEPDQVDAEFACNGGEQRQDDEGNLEEIEEERQEKHEDIDEDEKSDNASGQAGEQMFDPSRSMP